jgi:hypothetical protein
MVVAAQAHAAPKPEVELRKLVDVKIQAVNGEVEAKDWFFDGGAGLYLREDEEANPESVTLGMQITKHKVTSFAAHVAPDGGTALVSYVIWIKEKVTNDDGGLYNETNYRVTEIAKKTPAGWRVISGLWSIAQPNADVNKAAKAGKLGAFKPLTAGGGDKSLLDAFGKLVTGPFDDAAAKSKDLIAFGSGPNERTIGGASLAKAWQVAWASKLKVDSIVASNDPKATLGYVLANVTLTKTGYTIPFRVMFVFERKTAADPWSVIHAHFSVPAP